MRRALVASLLAFSLSAVAAEATPDNHALELTQRVRARPFYPPDFVLSTSFGGRAEVAYCVGADGFVNHLRLAVSSGNAEIDRSAKRMVKALRYVPLILDGQPVQLCGLRMPVTLEPVPARRTRDAFRREQDRVEQLIRAGRSSEARKALTALEPRSMSEAVMRDWLRVSLAEAEGDAAGQLAALLWLESEADRLGPDTRTRVRQNIFGLEVLLGKLGDAFVSHQNLEAQEAASLNASLRRAASDLIAAAQGTQPIATRLELRERAKDEVSPAFAATGLLRRAFSFAEIQGAIDLFTLSCGPDRVHVDRVALDKEWRVPAGWQGCTIRVYGKQGSSLRLIELASEPAAAASAPNP